MSITYGSVCSGIEAATCAVHPLGWYAAWFAEIEAAPSKLLAHHYPNVANMGDITLLPQLVTCGLIPAPDVLVGGTPCQAFSVAGLRNSLDDHRGQLSMTFIELADAIDDMRVGNECIVWWENVCGVLNTKDNAFGCFLGGLTGESSPLEPSGGRWTNAGCVYGRKRTVAWRILDAQYLGLAQRRKRVFVIASARAGISPEEILFEFDSLRRDTPPSRQAGQDTTATVAGRLDGSVPGGRQRCDSSDNYIVMATGQANAEILDNCVPTLQCNHEQLIVSFGLSGNIIGRKPENGGHQLGFSTDIGYTLTKTDVHGVVYGFEHGITQREGNPARFQNELSPTIRANMGDNQAAIVFHVDAQPDQMNFSNETSATLTKSQHAGVMMNTQVRRLTPTECEALQGFPRDYTNVAGLSDSVRYKALGNSMAVNVMAWIGKRIDKELRK